MGVCMCGVCNVGVFMFGFWNIWLFVCVGFVMYDCVYVWDL